MTRIAWLCWSVGVQAGGHLPPVQDAPLVAPIAQKSLVQQEKTWTFSQVIQSPHGPLLSPALAEWEKSYALFQKIRTSFSATPIQARKLLGEELEKCRLSAPSPVTPVFCLLFEAMDQQRKKAVFSPHRSGKSRRSQAQLEKEWQTCWKTDPPLTQKLDWSFSESLSFFQRFKLSQSRSLLHRVFRLASLPEGQSGDFLVAWALSLETHLLGGVSQTEIEKLYALALSARTGTHLAYAAYRLSLMKMGRGDCRGLEKNLSSFSFEDQPGLKLRSLYWRGLCAQTHQDHALFQELKNALITEFPLSLHAILLQERIDFSLNPFHWFELGGDPPVWFESEHQPGLNPLLRGAEFLKNRQDLAALKMLFHKMIPLLTQAEPEVQLYGFILMVRAELYPMGFQLLASCLRKNPKFISRTLMEALYPKEAWDLVTQTESELNPYLILALIRQESGFLPRVKSSAAAYGLMQLQIGTARLFEKWLTPEKLYDPKKNIHIGVKYLSKLYQEFDRHLEEALAGYNAGPLRVKAWKERYPTINSLLFLDLIPIQETREYVAAILRNYYWYLLLYDKGKEETLRWQLLQNLSPQ